MINVNNVRLQFGGRVLFEDVNLKFSEGNCYGIIGANGAGKSTFLRILEGSLEPSQGDVTIEKNKRMSVLSQNQNEYDEFSVLDTVLLGHKRLVEVMHARDEIYAKAEFTDEDGLKASELESEFAEMGGWEAESDAQILLNALGIDEKYQTTLMKDMDPKLKVKVLLAQSLFGNPDILILDEPTNNLDIKSIAWLENWLLDFQNCVIIVSHNRHFLNKVCTHICDVDYGKINIMVGNYDFWYETTELLARQAKETNKKLEQRASELKDFIQRFSANASKSKQATARKKELEKITLDDIKVSMRKYPYIDFKYEREIGNEILFVEHLTKKGFFEDVSFTVNHDEKIAFLSDNSNTISKLFDILAGEDEADSGSIKWGKTITTNYMPQNNSHYFEGCDLNLVQWLAQYSVDKYETFVRGWLGRMLFSGEEALKKASVLSGGEKVRCMLSRAMLSGANCIMLDEPTNHLDLESITALNKGMKNYKGILLFASHDQEIMSTVANRIIEINGTKTFDRFTDYESYLQLTINS